MPRIAIIDPLTLLGREISAEFRHRWPNEGDLLFFHAAEDEEHQVTQIGGHAALVPPLTDPGDLDSCEAVVLTTEIGSDRLDVFDRLLENRSNLLFLDASRLERYNHLTHPAIDADGLASGNRLRLAHPSIAVAGILTEALRAFSPERMTIAAIDPVSTYGKHAIDLLARQAVHRLQGETVKDLLDGQLLAFNMAAQGGKSLTEEAASLLPNLHVAATRTIGSSFHGHLILLGFGFEEIVDPDQINDCLEQTRGVLIASPPVNLDAITDRNEIVITPPAISPDGRTVAIQATVDGTRIGGALTAATIFQGLM